MCNEPHLIDNNCNMCFSDSTESVSVDDSVISKFSVQTDTDQTDADECNTDNDGTCTDDQSLLSSEEALFSRFDSVLSRSSVSKSSRTSGIVAQKCNGLCAGCTFET